ncbi:unnamed protein product [Auanema sp. JU1783]|nr:unnamed protein product [Auanema sp. JU1783]
MPCQMLSIHVGQCGNQLGQSFWKKMCEEHGINSYGRKTCEDLTDDKEVFFYQADDSHYIPRAVLIDLEPRVINGITQNPDFHHLFNTDNIFMSQHGGGAGNNWASGYVQGNEVNERILDIIEREVENSDRMDGFLFTHSVSGGTGSGLGSHILENVRDRFPKKVIQTYSVFASQQQDESAGDVVVAPYNCVLSMERLIEHADEVIVLDNSALNRLAAGKFQTQKPTFDHINSLVTRIMSTSTAPFRFQSPILSDIHSLHINPFPPLKFIQAGFSPVVDPDQKFTRKTSVNDIIRYLLKPTSMMVSTAHHSKSSHCMLAGLMLLQGNIEGEALHSTFYTERSVVHNINRAPWDDLNPLKIMYSPSSPYVKSQFKVSGLLLNNSTSIAPMFSKILAQFKKLRSKNAFIDRFTREEGFTADMMDHSAEQVSELIELYHDIEQENFFS